MRMAGTAKTALMALFLSLGAPISALAENYTDVLAEAQQSGEYAKALRLVEAEAEKGVPEAQYSLGRMYALGQGVEQDGIAAAQWYRKAAEQGLTEAQYQLGEAYGEGIGVPQDYVRAYQWMSRAAQSGDQQAKAALASFEELMSDKQLKKARQLVSGSQ